MSWLILTWSQLSPFAKKVLLVSTLLIITGACIMFYGWSKEQQGRREAHVVQLDTQVQHELATTKTQYREESLHVETVKKARPKARVVHVVRPGIVQIRDTTREVPVEVTSQLTADSTRLAQDVLMFDTLLVGWHGAIQVADSARKSSQLWKAQAQTSHWKRNTAIVVTVLAAIGTVVHFAK